MMKFSPKLNEFDVLDLLNEYHSEQRKLKSKLSFVKQRISELEEEYERILKRKTKTSSTGLGAEIDEMEHALQQDADEAFEEMPNNVPDVQAEPVVANEKPKRAKKSDSAVKEKKTRKKKSKAGRKQQPLSLWDQMIVDSIKAKGKPAINKDILSYITTKAIEHGVYENEEKTRVKLNQCLIKLTADNRKAVVKVPYEGRGHAYALPKWVNKEGELLEAYR